MRDALSVFAPIRPIYFSICPFIGLSPAAFAKTAGESPSCCGCKAPPTCGFTKQGYKGKCSGAYTMTNFMEGESGPALNPAYPVIPASLMLATRMSTAAQEKSLKCPTKRL